MSAKKKPTKPKVKAVKQSFFAPGTFDIKDVKNLSWFDLTGEKTKTKGSANRQYTTELHADKNSQRAQVYFIFGAVGGRQNEGWKHFESLEDAEKEFNKTVKSKIKKGYTEIDVAQRAIGSEEAKKIVKPVTLKNVSSVTNSTGLHPETARIISSLMGATSNWTAETLRCPLGQLSNEQIEKGRNCLDEARKIVASKKPDPKKLESLTNRFYGLIPHNLGSGSRGQLTHLLLDSKDKIDQKEYDLDTLLDAKSIGGSLVSDSVMDQYKSLDTDFNYIDHNDTLFKWLDLLIQKTKANNHRYLGNVVLLNAWNIERKGERDIFLNSANIISKECGKQVIPHSNKELVKDRPDGNTELFQKANVIPLFHGPRTQNITGILKKGMLIRPSGVVVTGSMYGSQCIYWSNLSTKSINYTNIRSSYWAKGDDDRAFLFLSDCALGNQLMARGPYHYTPENIKPNHSVWAKGGQSGVINDEIMLYNTNQHNLRYLLEFSCL